MDRRNFIKTALLGGLGLAVVPLIGKGAEKDGEYPKVIKVKSGKQWYNVPLVKTNEASSKVTILTLESDTTTMTLGSFNGNGWGLGE